MRDPLTAANRNLRPHWTAYVSGALMLLLLAGVLGLWLADVRSATLAWAPSWDAELRLELDGLGFLYALVASGVGLAVAVFSIRYVPRHLEETGAPQSRQARFYGLLSLFALSMVGLATAGDLLLLFVFWDLTAIASYFLIAFDREQQEARRSALAAMLVTGITAVLLLIGAVVLWARYGSFVLEDVFARAEADTLTTAALALIIVAALAKSAQAPFHFWLPRAMVAPTPISAYLHAAAMVAAGVLLIGRMYPLIDQSQLLRDLLLGFGLASIAVGALLAMAADELKLVLAYSTISQYGYVVVMYGLGGGLAATAAAFYVLGHAVEKSALFFTAGAVGQAAHTERLSELGGLRRTMPGLALGSGLAAAGIAALPLTVGFFQDELFFKAAIERGWAVTAAAAVASVLTIVYIGRFWTRIFLGAPRRRVDEIPGSLVTPVIALGALIAVGGVWPGPLERLAEEAGAASVASGVHADASYHLDLRTENALALAAYALGGTLLAAFAVWRPLVAALARIGAETGPARIYDAMLAALNRLSDSVHRFEVRDLRTRVAAVLIPAGILAAAGLIASQPPGTFEVGVFAARDIELAVAIGAAALAAVGLTFIRPHLFLVLLLAGVGYALAVVYAFFGAPEVALVAVLAETVLAIIFVGVLALMPPEVMRREVRLARAKGGRRRDQALAAVAGLFAFLVAWGALSGPQSRQAVGPDYPQLASQAHAKDTVTAILGDFRALDTMGEVTVVAVAVLGVVGLMRRGRLR